MSTEMLGCKPRLCQIKSSDDFLAKDRDTPSSDGVDGIDDTWRQLASLPSLARCSLIKNVVWLAVYSREICIEQCIVLESGWRLLANLALSTHSRDSKSRLSSPQKLVWEAYARMALWGLRSCLLRWLCLGCWWKCIWRSKSVLRRLLVHCISHAFRYYHLLRVVVRIFSFVFQTLFQSIDAFQQGFEYVGFGASFLGNRICARRVSLDALLRNEGITPDHRCSRS